MATYLLTWNPRKWSWDIDPVLQEMRAHVFFDSRWSCGRSRRLRQGDRFFLMRQGVEPRGIMAAGLIMSAPYSDEHWDSSRRDDTRYVNIRFDAFVDPDQDGVLPRSMLRTAVSPDVNWDTQTSGIQIPTEVASTLNSYWQSFLDRIGVTNVVIPEEIITPSAYYEGAVTQITVNRYERDPQARRACVEHYGARCKACGFDFGVTYGSRGEGFIHVHHVVPLSEIKQGYQVDPVRDLVPLCANCHAMIHRSNDIISVESLTALLDQQERRRPRPN